MLTIGILAPMEEELQAILALYPQASKKTHNNDEYFEVNLDEKRIILMKCGVGKVNGSICVMKLSGICKVDIIFNLGTAGGMKLGQKELEIVVAKELVYTDVDITPLGYPYGQMAGEPESFKSDEELVKIALSCTENLPKIYSGTVGTSDAFIASTAVPAIQEKFGNRILCAEMEGCAVAHTCSKLGIRCIVIRSLSDCPSEDDKSHVNMDKFVEKASTNAAILVSQMIKKIK
ncbi:adenosylhomocysteine nucleosidase [Entamoeba marina]